MWRVGSRKEINKEHISQITRKSTWEVLVTRFDLNRKCNIQFYKEEKKEKKPSRLALFDGEKKQRKSDKLSHIFRWLKNCD
jgi:hypothetical protein